MSAKLGDLGRPRLALALVWLIGEPARTPDDSAGSGPSGGDPARAAPAPGVGGEAEDPPLTADDIELVRAVTGLAPGELVARLQAIAAYFAERPGELRAELVRIAGGDELAAAYLMQLIEAALPDAASAPAAAPAAPESDPDGDRNGAPVLDFSPPDEPDDEP